MSNERIPVDRVIGKLDEYLHADDYDGAARHLLYWKAEAENACDMRGELTINVELMGLYRKTGKKAEAVAAAERAVALLSELDLSESVTAGTVYVDAATVYNAFADQEKSLEYFEKARAVYEKFLVSSDPRLAALYNNFALNLVALGRYERAKEYYDRALAIGKTAKTGAAVADAAITYLNLANYYEALLGIENALDEIEDCLINAKNLLSSVTERDGYYAFVCEKCANTFGYYGFVEYAEELKRTAKEIYERA